MPAHFNIVARKRRSVLLAITDTHHGFLKGVVRYAQEHHWHLAADMIYTARVPWGWQGDGIVSFVGYRDDLAEFIVSSKLPTVDISFLRTDLDVPKVGGDNQVIGRLAADHFLAKGYRHYAWAPFIDTGAASDRYENYASQLGQHGFPCHQLPPLDALGSNAKHGWNRRRRELIRTLRQLPKPLAVFAFNDYVAYEIVHACEEAGLPVPESVAVLGVDNDPLFCESAGVHLSSICHDLEGIAYEAAALLDRIMSGKAPPKENLKLPPKGLITRRSTDILAVNHLQVARALRFIAERYSDLQLDINSVARATSISRRMLERVFRRHLGRTVNEEIVRVRLVRAQEMLLSPASPTISEVALATGFARSNHFHRTFKKHFGNTPMAYVQAR